MSAKIGILGGLGPEATNELYRQIIQYTPAEKDQDHIQTLIFSNPKIPDRTKSILFNGKNPSQEMIKTAKILEKAGSNFIIIPCNTAHYFIDEIQMNIGIPILNMIKETVNFISKNYPDVKKVGLLATTGTIQTKVYEKELKKVGIETIIPSNEEQELLVMESIYGKKGIKAKYKRYPRLLLEKAGADLTEKGAELIICGCTEISMIMDQKKIPYVLINPSEIIAKIAIQRALTEKQGEVVVSEIAEETIREVVEEEE